MIHSKKIVVGLSLVLLVVSSLACGNASSAPTPESAYEESHPSLATATVVATTDALPRQCALARYIVGAEARCDYLNKCAGSISIEDQARARAILSLVANSHGSCGQVKITVVRNLLPYVQDSFDSLVRCQTVLADVVDEMNDIPLHVERLEQDFAAAIMEHFRDEDAGCVEKLARVATFGSTTSPYFVKAYLDRYGQPTSFEEARLLLQMLYSTESSREIVHDTGLSLLPRSINLATNWFEMTALDFTVPKEDPFGYSYTLLRNEISLKKGQLQ